MVDVAKAKVELRFQGLNAVMKSEGVSEELARRGERIARAAGKGFVARTNDPIHRWVARTWVEADTYEARAREARDNVLTRALDAGRG